MKLALFFGQLIVSLAQSNIVDSTSILSQYGDGSRVLSGTSRDLLKQFQLDLDDLSARMGATTFGRAESIDQKLFRSLRYVVIFSFLSDQLDAANLNRHLMQMKYQRPP